MKKIRHSKLPITLISDDHLMVGMTGLMRMEIGLRVTNLIQISSNYLKINKTGVNMFQSYLVAGVVLAVFYLVYVLYYDDYQDFFKF